MYNNLLPFALGYGVAGAKVYITNTSESETTHIFSDKYGTEASQPLTIDQYGRVDCYAPEGIYDVVVRDADTNAELFSLECVVCTSPFIDAPNDGTEYIRKNKTWATTQHGLFVSGDGLNHGEND